MRKWTWIILPLMLIALLSGCKSSEESGQPSPASWQTQYDLGVRYLSEGNYQEAILAFTAAIEIDPKQALAYVGRGDAYVAAAQELSHGVTEPEQLGEDAIAAYQNAVEDYLRALDLDERDAELYQKTAEVYLTLGETDAAAEILGQGFQTTENQALQELFDELSGAFTMGEIPQDSAEYAALEDFLSCFGWYWFDYDAKTVTMATDRDKPRSLLELLLTVPFCYSYQDTIYPGEDMEFVWDGSLDPLERYGDFGYCRASISKMDWLLKNIFNCDQADITRMKGPIMTGQNEDVYGLDGYYYFPIPGIGGGYIAKITSIERSGLRYYVEYGLQSIYEDEPTPYCAQVSLKQIGGETYWTLYNKQMMGQPCGDNLTWKLQMGTLTISGTGPMTDFNPYRFSDEPAPPWVDEYISAIIIEDGVTSIGAYAFWGCKYLTDVRIPDSVTDIGAYAFWVCSQLKDISLPNRLRSIGDYAFQGCGFETFTVPPGVGSVSEGMLMECDNLTSVTIAEGITRIERDAFYFCPNMRSVTIPGSVRYIGEEVFGRCLNLSDIYFAGSQNELSAAGLPDYAKIHYNSTGPVR